MNPVATLSSGGSIVINPTEALVAVDVNSGKSTKERHIDETALKTNLEAADEIARQMRLRDLGGLIVIDFIDMNDPKHIQAVEKRLKDALRNDRARIQVGRISQFGLLELSRQRLRPSIIETNMKPCPHCKGAGVIRSIESMALHVLRAIEAEGIAGHNAEILVTVPADVDLYLLNQKRAMLINMEQRYNLFAQIQRDNSLVAPEFKIEAIKQRDYKPSVIEKVIELQSSMDKPLNKQKIVVVEIETDAALVEPIDEVIVETPAALTTQPQDKRRQRHGLFNNRRRGQHKKTQNPEEGMPSSEKIISDHIDAPSSDMPSLHSTGESITGETQEKAEKKAGRRRRQRRGQNNRNKPLAVEDDTSNKDIPSSERPEPTPTIASNPSSTPESGEKKKKRGWWKRLLETS
jgi:ribonuclease E